MTNLEKFKANYPNAPLKENGLPEQIQCPYQLGEPYKDKCVRPDDCAGCWGMEEALTIERGEHNLTCGYGMCFEPYTCICKTCVNDNGECCLTTRKGCHATDCTDYIKEETK